MSARETRGLAIAGIGFVVLLVLSGFLAPSPPHAHASATKVVAYYHDHKSGIRVEAYLIVLAVCLGIGVFWYLRDLISTGDTAQRMATIGFGGGLLFGASGGLAAGIFWATTDSVGHLDPSAIQAFNVWQADGVSLLLAVGESVFLVATGLAIVSGGALPRWLGWLGVALGVLSLIVPFQAGPLPAGLWVLIASILLLVRAPAVVPEGGRAVTAEAA